MEKKLELVKLSRNSWHFKLNTYMFGKKIINNTMTNLCPYFWLLIGAMLLTPIIVPIDFILWKPFKWVLNGIFNCMDKRLDAWLNNWTNSITPEQATDMFDVDGYIHNTDFFNIPRRIRKLDYNKTISIIDKWAMKNLKIDIKTAKGRIEWQEYVNKMTEKRQKALKEARARQEEARLSYLELRKKREAREEKIKNFFNSIAKPFNWFFRGLRKLFTFNTPGKIIQMTKKVVGALITGGLVVGFYYVLHVIVFLVMLIANAWNGPEILRITLIVLPIIGAGGVLVLFSWLVGKGIVNLLDKYRNTGKTNMFFDSLLWMCKYFIYYPVKILVWYPIYFIFVSFFWNTLCKAIVWNSLTSFWRGLMSVSGIFGEYFGRSKGDYCPGVKWED